MIRAVAILDGLGGPEVFFIGLLALLMFGSKRLPELGRAMGRAMREFRRATSGVEENLRDVFREEPARPALRAPSHRGPARASQPLPAAKSEPGPAADSAAPSAAKSESASATDTATSSATDTVPRDSHDPYAPPDDEVVN